LNIGKRSARGFCRPIEDESDRSASVFLNPDAELCRGLSELQFGKISVGAHVMGGIESGAPQLHKRYEVTSVPSNPLQKTELLAAMPDSGRGLI
jgi:hypothetical protein